MAASQQQKVDFLLKKIGYTASKTGLAEDSSLSGTKKAPFAEAVPSPLVIASTCLWADSTYIPATPPGSDSDYVKVYLSAASGHRMTVDSTVSGNRAYIAYSTYNDNGTAILGDWIDTQFGASYIIKVYKGDPNSGGVQLSAAGSGSNDGWFFDYSAGILNFNDTNVPSGVTDSNIYVVGYRYIGTKGPTAAGGISTFTTQYVSGVSTFADDVNLYGTTGVTSAYWDKTGDAVILKDHTKASFGTGQDLEFFHDGANSTIKNTTGTLFVDNGGTTFRNVSGTETQLAISDNGSVAAYFDNAKKIETLSVGATVTGNLGATSVSISGISTFEGNVDANGTLDVDGQSELDDVNVSGVSTFGQLVSASAGANIAGAAGLNVAGVTTVGGQIDGNAGADISGGETTLSSATISDLTSGRLTVAGTSGALQDSSNLTFDGTNKLAVTGGLTVSAGATLSSNLDVDGGADISGGGGTTLNVVGHTELDRVNVSAASTFGGDIDANGNIDVDGRADLDDVVVTGVATFSNNIDADGNLDVDGRTDLDDVVVTGVATFSALVDGNAGANFSGAETTLSSATVSDLTDNRIVLAGTSGSLEDSSKITFDGTTLAIVGDATFTGNVSVAGTLTSEDKENIDSVGLITARTGVRITSGGLTVNSGVSTFTDAIDANGGLDVAGGSGLVASSAKISDLTSGRVVVAGTSGELEDASTFTFSGGTVSATAFSGTNLTGTLQTAAQPNITSLGTIASLVASRSQVTGVGGFSVTGVSTFTGDIDANGNIDVDGRADLDDVVVTGVATFSNNIDADGDLDVDGHTELDYVNVSAAATFAGFIDANAGANVAGGFVANSAKISDLTSGRVPVVGTDGELEDASTFTFSGGTVTATGFSGNLTGTLQTAAQGNVTSVGTLTGLDVNGHTELDNIQVTGIATVANVVLTKNTTGVGATIGGLNVGVVTYYGDGSQLTGIDATALKDSGGNVKVQAVTTGAVVTGLITATQGFSGEITGVGATFTNITGTLQTAAQTNITSLGTLTALTVTGNVDANAGLDVTGVGGLSVTGVSTFTGAVDANGGVDISGGANTLNVTGHTELDNLNVSGIATIANVVLTKNTTGVGATVGGQNVGVVTYYGDGSKLTGTGSDSGGTQRVEVVNTGVILVGVITATDQFSGQITGVGATFTNITGTLVTGAQTNITSLGNLTGLTINGDEEFYGSAGVTSAIWDKSENTLNFKDHTKATFGTGNDISIYHDGANSYVDNATGDFFIRNNSNAIKIRPKNDEESIVAHENGSVQLFFDNSQKFETTYTGTVTTGIGTFSGGVKIADDKSLTVGNDDNLYIKHSDGHGKNFFVSSVGDCEFHMAGSEKAMEFKTNGSVDIYYNASKKFETTHTGAIVTGIATATTFSVGDGSHSTDRISIGDDNDFALYHNGSNSFIADRGTGPLYIRGNNAVRIESYTNDAAGEAMIIANSDGAVEAYYDASKKFETTYHGAIVTGILTATSDIKTTANIYGAQGHFTDHIYIADKIVHTGDTNTAIRFPTNDTFTVETAGSERLRITSAGNVGIGTDAPTNFNAAADNLVVGGGAGHHGMTIWSAADGDGWLVFNDAVNTNLTGAVQYNHVSDYMAFRTATTERLQITSNGRVLIGTGAVGASSNLVAQGGLQVSANGASGAPSLCIGADGTGANTQSLTDDTVKDCRIGYPNYDIDEEPLALISGFVGDGSSLDDNDGARIYIGGGTSYLNAVNQVRFYTQNTNIATVTGTERFRIGPDGTADFNSNTVQKAVLKNYTETVKAVGNTGTSATLDLADGNVFTATLNGNCTFTFTTGTNSAPNAASFTLILANDSTPSRTITWPAAVKWPNNSAPSRTTAASKTDIWTFMTPDNGTTWYGNIALYNFT